VDAAVILAQDGMHAVHSTRSAMGSWTHGLLADILPLRMCDTRARDALGVDVGPALRTSFGAFLATPTLDAVGLYALSTSRVVVENTDLLEHNVAYEPARADGTSPRAPAPPCRPRLQRGGRRLCALGWHRCKPARSFVSRAWYVVVDAGGVFYSLHGR
jgi:hypothetical protein